MAGPLTPVLISLGGTLLRIAAKELPKYLNKGAKIIKKPLQSTKAQKAGWVRRQTAQDKKDKQLAKLAKKTSKSYNPRHGQPKGHKRLLKEDASGISRLYEDIEDTLADSTAEDIQKKGGLVKGRPRGIGKALRGGGAVTRS